MPDRRIVLKEYKNEKSKNTNSVTWHTDYFYREKERHQTFEVKNLTN